MDSVKQDRDAIEHPVQYQFGDDDKFEVIKVLEAWLTPTEFMGFMKGNALKYDARHRQKGGLDDLMKARWYQNRLVDFCQRMHLDGKNEHVTPTQVYVTINYDGSTTKWDNLISAQTHLINEAERRAAPPTLDTADEPRKLHRPPKIKSSVVFDEPRDARGYRIGKRAKLTRPFKRYRAKR